MLDIKNYPDIISVADMMKLGKEVEVMRKDGKTLIQFLNDKNLDSQLKKGLIKARLINLKNHGIKRT